MPDTQTTERGSESARAHLNWCVDRAMQYADMTNAWASFISDCRKHPGTKFIASHELLTTAMMSGIYRTPADFRNFISGWAVKA